MHLAHKTPTLPRKQNLLPHVRHSHILRLSSRENHTLLRLGVPRNRPHCTHHYSPRHAHPVRTARSIVGICERYQTKPRQRPLLKRNLKRTRPHCIPQYTTRRVPVDQLRRTVIPCYCPHCIRDIRPGQLGNPQKRTDQLSKRKQNIRLVNIKIQSLQVVRIGIPLPHSAPYFSPNSSVYVCC